MAQIVARWEWRTFARSVRADAVFDALAATTVDESDEVYLLAPGGDNVKVRHGLVDVKVLRETDAAGLQRWEPILKAPFPLDAGTARTVLQSLRGPPPSLPTDGLSLDDVVAAAGVGEPGDLRVVPVRKQRHRYTVAGCQAERAVFEVGPHRTTSIAVESTDPAAVLATIEHLGLTGYVNIGRPHRRPPAGRRGPAALRRHRRRDQLDQVPRRRAPCRRARTLANGGRPSGRHPAR